MLNAVSSQLVTTADFPTKKPGQGAIETPHDPAYRHHWLFPQKPVNKRFLVFVVYLATLGGPGFSSGCNVGTIGENPQSKATSMQIQFKTEGGIAFIPRLSQPTTINSQELSNEQRDELQRLITEARFFELPRKLGPPPPGAADYQQYTVTIKEDGRQHTVQFTDFADEPALKKLFAFLSSLRPGP